MDITGATALQMRMAVSHMDAGESVEFEGISFRLLNGRLQVESFSTLAPGFATPLHTQEQISKSKAVLDEFAQLCPEFGEVAQRIPAEFLCSYGRGAAMVPLAREHNGQFEWLGSAA